MQQYAAGHIICPKNYDIVNLHMLCVICPNPKFNSLPFKCDY